MTLTLSLTLRHSQVKGGSYKEMSGLAAEYSFVFVIEAFTVLVLVVKSLKYFQLQKDLMLLQKTLGQAIADLGVFLGMLAILFAGFVIMGLNIFGMQVRSVTPRLDPVSTRSRLGFDSTRFSTRLKSTWLDSTRLGSTRLGSTRLDST